ncbi:MAG: hypothetical protein LBC79_07780 [Deltaproteobacteria bacterium]|jgi:hypothetical protein|nr:hypothetical protein [Deltaproteobacteria bacterium]
MKGKRALGSFGVLAAMVLLVAVLFNGAWYQHYLYLTAFSAWAGCLLLRWLWRKRPRLRRRKPKRKDRKASLSTKADRLLAGHLNWRITEQLRSVYPEAVWQWQTAHPARVAQGGIGRILLYGAGGYTHADVTVDGYYRISLDMLEVTPLQTLLGNPPPPVPVDPAEWFETFGRQALTDVIMDLNPRGYTRMYLRENGEVYTLEGGAESVKETLQHMPGKAMWQELCAVFTRQGLNAAAEPDRIVLTWA